MAIGTVLLSVDAGPSAPPSTAADEGHSVFWFWTDNKIAFIASRDREKAHVVTRHGVDGAT